MMRLSNKYHNVGYVFIVSIDVLMQDMLLTFSEMFELDIFSEMLFFRLSKRLIQQQVDWNWEFFFIILNEFAREC